MTGNKPVSTNIATTKIAPIKPNPPPIQNKQPTNSNFMSVPADVVKKLQQGNDSFIVAYNPAIIPKKI